MVATLVAPGDDEGETVGQLYDRLPASGDWLALPEYSVRVRRCRDAETPARATDAGAGHERN